MPHTLSGRLVACAILITGRVLVLVAKIAEGLTMPSSSANSACFAVSSSRIDSMTRSQFARSVNDSVMLMCDNTVARSSSVIFPLDTCFARLPSTVASMDCAPLSVRERTTTFIPARATTSASPEPMIPDPQMPTSCGVVLVIGCNGSQAP